MWFLICIPLVCADGSLKHQESYHKLIHDAYFKDAKSVAELQWKVTRELKGEKDSLTLQWMNNLAEADFMLAHYKDALQILEIVGLQAEAQAQITTDFSNQLLRSLMLKANVQQSMGFIDACQQTVKEAFDLVNTHTYTDSETLAQLHMVKAKLDIDMGKDGEAQESLTKALRIFEEKSLPLWKARAQQLAGELLLQRGQLIQGRDLIDQAIYVNWAIGD